MVRLRSNILPLAWCGVFADRSDPVSNGRLVSPLAVSNVVQDASAVCLVEQIVDWEIYLLAYRSVQSCGEHCGRQFQFLG